MSEAHAPNLLAMATAHFNEPIICHSEIARLIGYGETGVDCYLIVQRMGGNVMWSTCVGGYIFLDRLAGQDAAAEWDDLKRLDNLLALNGAPQAAAMRIEYHHDDMETPRLRRRK